MNEALNYSQKQINGSLATLIEKALITRKDAYFCAIPFEEALELLIERKKQQTESVQENIEKLLVNWKNEE